MSDAWSEYRFQKPVTQIQKDFFSFILILFFLRIQHKYFKTATVCLYVYVYCVYMNMHIYIHTMCMMHFTPTNEKKEHTYIHTYIRYH